MKKIVLIILVVILAGGGIGAGLYFGGFIGQTELPEGELAEGEELEEEEEAPPIYLPLDPAFIVNFTHRGTLRYLQITLEVMSTDQAVIDEVTAEMPAIRNSLIMLFSNQEYENLSSREGKESLRLQVLESVNEQLDSDGVDEIYITSFVMQ